MPEMQAYYLVANDESGESLDNVIPMTANDFYPGAFPGYVGISADNIGTVDGYIPTDFPSSIGTDTPSGNIDYTSHGESGMVNTNSYSTAGPVEPNLVENFELYGYVVGGFRRPEYGNGPVGAYDHGEYTAMQIAQQMSPETWTEASIMSLLTGGI